MNANKNAEEYLVQFLSSFPALSEEMVQLLSKMIPVKSFKKGDIILKEGQVPQECYYILAGLVRQYQFVDGVERTTDFYYEQNATVSSTNYAEQSASPFYLICEEDCILIAGNMDVDESNYEQFPELMEITKQMLEVDLNKLKAEHTRFILSSPKERYLHFMETKGTLLNRVPLHQIASYLGMTAESLSRIRKRIAAAD